VGGKDGDTERRLPGRCCIQPADLGASRGSWVCHSEAAPRRLGQGLGRGTGRTPCLFRRWADLESSRRADAGDFGRLCDPGSGQFIVDYSDYYAWFTETLFCGRVGGVTGRPR